MSLRVFINSVIALTMTTSALAQGPQKPQLSYAANGAPIAVQPKAPVVPEMPRVSILVSAFRPFHRSETNMAQMVADALQQLSRNDYRYRNLTLDRVDLDVVYDSSSEALIQKIRSGQTPDIILSIGQGALKGVVIETGGDADSSRFPDIHGRGRNEGNFPSLSEEIGFNFPVQDMYCSLPAESRKKVSISYKGGNFVCNDLAYYMGQYVRPKQEIDSAYQNFESQIMGQYNSTVRSVDYQLAQDIAAARIEFDRITLEEAPARAQYEQALSGVRQRNAVRKAQIDRDFQYDLQRFEAQEKEDEQFRNQQAPQTYQTVGGPVTVYREGDLYGPPSGNGNGNSNYPALRRVPPRPNYSSLEPEPYFNSKAYDRSTELRNRADSEKQQAKYKAESSLARAKTLKNLLGSNGKTRFVFIHVPVSDGIAYQQKYQLVDGICVTSRNDVPSNGDWYDEATAANYSETSISALRTRARGFIAQSFKDYSRAEKQADGSGAYVPRPKSVAPEVCEVPGGPVYQEEIIDGNNRRTGQFYKVTPPPKGRFFYSLRAYSQKAELREQSEANSYATTILDMVNGALRRSQAAYPKSLPLPTFSNNLRMPRGDSERQQAITTLKNLGYGYVQQSQVLRAGTKKGEYDTISTPIPPQMSASEADCYADVLKKMGQDQKEDKAAGPRRY